MKAKFRRLVIGLVALGTGAVASASSAAEPTDTRRVGRSSVYQNLPGESLEALSTPDEIKGLLELRVSPKKSCSDVRHLAGEKVTDIEARIRSLQKMRKALLKLAEQCDAGGGKSTCPLLDYLESEL